MVMRLYLIVKPPGNFLSDQRKLLSLIRFFIFKGEIVVQWIENLVNLHKGLRWCKDARETGRFFIYRRGQNDEITIYSLYEAWKP